MSTTNASCNPTPVSQPGVPHSSGHAVTRTFEPHPQGQTEARQVLLNGLWTTSRQALSMIGRALETFAAADRNRTASILGEIFLAGAGVIERRMRQ